MSVQVSIERAELRHVDEIAPLFDAYGASTATSMIRGHAYFWRSGLHATSRWCLSHDYRAPRSVSPNSTRASLQCPWLARSCCYAREGWVRDNDFYVYEYHLP